MNAVITRRGSGGTGSGTPYAFIIAHIPAASSATCSKGGVTLHPRLIAQGIAMFVVTEQGEWTVTAARGVETVSASVNISAEGQREEVTIEFSNRITVSDFVSAAKTFLGSSLTATAPTIAVVGSYYEFKFERGTARAGIVYKPNPIYLADRTSVKVIGSVTQSSGVTEEQRTSLYLWSSIGGDYIGDNVMFYDVSKRGSYAIYDISNIDFSETGGFAYIGFAVSVTQNETTTVKAARLELT